MKFNGFITHCTVSIREIVDFIDVASYKIRIRVNRKSSINTFDIKASISSPLISDFAIEYIGLNFSLSIKDACQAKKRDDR